MNMIFRIGVCVCVCVAINNGLAATGDDGVTVTWACATWELWCSRSSVDWRFQFHY